MIEAYAIDPLRLEALSGLAPLSLSPLASRPTVRRSAKGLAAMVAVNGSLQPGYGRSDRATGYGTVTMEIEAAAADPAVTSIEMLISSPGGSIAGLVPTMRAIRKARAAKPVFAVVAGMACSAAYALASQATEIVASDPLDLVGSIGVVMVHIDISQALGQAGIKPSLIYAGARKVDGSPYQPLSPEAEKRLQNEVDNAAAIVFAEISAGRPRLSVEAIKKMEAAVFQSFDSKTGRRPALDLGLVDHVVGVAGPAPRQAVAAMWSAAAAAASERLAS
ncbi:S49 family peptidase [Bosea sp. (in: a-proteobacteria)]|uniref:S49 family peptidase n=1 Tax=Bosea sp. (in: a-proteobacteria) TaxID=1871050 RepID=UPI002B48ACD5|nr:S49 family peptidase [Bosea sp. (in: a-proteobacteria)]WRH59310.1 MAG: S49 family peptidase [Bosea sp. (in: a-proteobacteria)]